MYKILSCQVDIRSENETKKKERKKIKEDTEIQFCMTWRGKDRDGEK